MQFSGLVVSTDSLMGLPLVSVRIQGTNKGTYSDASGFFTFVARKGDTINFTSIGYKPAQFIIPVFLKSYHYSFVQPMASDTVYLPEAVIHSWPTQEEFNYYFVHAKISDEDVYRARYNTRRDVLKDMANNMTMNGNEQGRYYFQQQANQYYYNGQLPPQRLFDPFAWDEFFSSWKRGDYKKKN